MGVSFPIEAIFLVGECMFGSLIRRKTGRSVEQDDAAFEFDDIFAVDRGAAAVRAAQ